VVCGIVVKNVEGQMKIDVTVSKKFTINTGDFSSIQPNVSLTMKDVEAENVIEAHTLLETIVDGLFHIQMKTDGRTMGTLKNMKFGSFLSELDEDDILEGVKEAMDNLRGLV
jgi:hypothetical protein